MANHVVNIDIFDPASINSALSEFRRISADVDRKFGQFLQEIAQLVEDTLKANYGGAVLVDATPQGDGYTINANGKAVVFLEFGAGLLTDSSDRYASVMDFPVYEGSYSELAGSGEYYATGKWHFNKREYQYIVPTNAMQRAYEAVMQNYQTIARRVFG